MDQARPTYRQSIFDVDDVVGNMEDFTPSRPESMISEASHHSDMKPFSILRRASAASSSSQGERLPPPSPISKRNSRVRFSEGGRPISIASSSSSNRRASSHSTTTMSDTPGSSQARRLSTRRSSEYIRAASPSDFAPRPLRMPRYTGPPAQSYAPDLRRSSTSRSSVSAEILTADTERRSSLPGPSRRTSMALSATSSTGESRRSSARFSILSDPQDLDLLASLGGVPDFDDFFNDSVRASDRPQSTNLDDLMVSPPPAVALPSPGQCSPTRKINTTTTSESFVTPTISRVNRALSPIHGEDEVTPISRTIPTFSSSLEPSVEPNPAFTDITPMGQRLGRSGSLTTPLLAFPIPPPRSLSFDNVQSALTDEIDKLVASESAVVSSVTASILQPAPVLAIASQSPKRGSGSADTSAEDIASHVDSDVDFDIAVTVESPEEDDRLLDEFYDQEKDTAPTLSEPEDDSVSGDTGEVTEDEFEEDMPGDFEPSSPGVESLMNHFRQARASDSDCFEDDEADYDVPLHEAAVQAGILSSRSQLIWPSKPKRRTFIPPRLALPTIQAESSSGWSGSESEEEEFNAVLSSIGQRKLAQKAYKRHLTPPKEEYRSSLRLSMMSESSTSSASSIEILTPDPHRTTFNMGPYDPLNNTSRSPSISRSWSTKKATSNSALGIPMPTAVLQSRRTSLIRVLPAPKRSVKGWGRPEVLLEDDEAPLVHSSSEEEDTYKSYRSSTPESASRTKGKKEESPITCIGAIGGVSGSGGEDEWLMDETEPEFDDGEDYSSAIPSARYLGVPF